MTVAFSTRKISIIIRRWRNLGYSHSTENFKNVCVMFQKIIEYLNTITRYPGRSFIKFERDESSLKFHFVYVLSAKFLGNPYYEPQAWFMILGNRNSKER